MVVARCRAGAQGTVDRQAGEERKPASTCRHPAAAAAAETAYVILGLGIDAVDIGRVERMFADKRDRMLVRLFTEDELSYVRGRPAPAQHLAARLAAKEAAYKA